MIASDWQDLIDFNKCWLLLCSKNKWNNMENHCMMQPLLVLPPILPNPKHTFSNIQTNLFFFYPHETNHPNHTTIYSNVQVVVLSVDIFGASDRFDCLFLDRSRWPLWSTKRRDRRWTGVNGWTGVGLGWTGDQCRWVGSCYPHFFC